MAPRASSRMSLRAKHRRLLSLAKNPLRQKVSLRVVATEFAASCRGAAAGAGFAGMSWAAGDGPLTAAFCAARLAARQA